MYFCDDLWGAMVLHHFTDMLGVVFQDSPVKFTLVEQELSLKHPAVLGPLQQSYENPSAPLAPDLTPGGRQPRTECGIQITV